MCEKKIRKITRGSRLARLREARRLERIQRMTPSPAIREDHHARLPQIALPINKEAQKQVILELAWKTVALMHKNKIIQQKIIALQKETSEFVATMMKNPQNGVRYLDLRTNLQATSTNVTHPSPENKENSKIISNAESGVGNA